MYLLRGVVVDEHTIQISYDNSGGCHSTETEFPHAIRFRDIYDFCITMGMAKDTLPEHWDGFSNYVGRQISDMSRFITYEISFRPEDCYNNEHAAFELVRKNLGLFLQFATWNHIRRRSALTVETPIGSAVSTVACTAGSDVQNIDWLVDLSVEKPAKMVVNTASGFKEIMISLPDGCVGKVAASYTPDTVVANAYMGAVRTMRSITEQHISKMKVIEDQIKSASMQESFELLQTVAKHGWTVTPKGFFYGHRIVVEQIYYNGKMFDIPADLAETFYMDGIYIPFERRITTATGMGYNPHCYSEKCYDLLCIGDIYGKPLIDMIKIPEMMKTIYVHSMYDNDAGLLMDMIIGRERDGYTEYCPETGEYYILPRFMQYAHLEGYLRDKINAGECDGEVFGEDVKWDNE